MGQMTRRVLIGAGAAGVAAAGAGYWMLKRKPTPAPLGFSLSAEELARGRALLEAHPAIDAHAHPGRTFVRGAKGLPPLLKLYAAKGTFEGDAIEDMKQGGLGACVFAGVADFNVLDLSKDKGLHPRRPFKDGEAWASYERQIANLKALSRRGLVHPLLAPDDLDDARALQKPGAVWSMEGADFLGGSVERLRESYQDGLRTITLVHYRTNELGDVMTDQPSHDRLTDAGAQIVREMNRLGMIVDLAHMAETGAFGALEASSRPVMISHAHIRSPQLDHPRFISPELAAAVASGGGLVGAWPAGIGVKDMNGFIDRIFELVDLVGIDHACLGTDMDANYKPVFDTYTRLPDLAGALLSRGMNEDEAAKFLGGNFLRLWRAAAAVAAPS